MSSIIHTINQRRIAARNERIMWRVINNAGTPSLRDELIVLHQIKSGSVR